MKPMGTVHIRFGNVCKCFMDNLDPLEILKHHGVQEEKIEELEKSSN